MGKQTSAYLSQNLVEHVNVLRFSACWMRHCNCGAQLTLGIRSDQMPKVLEALIACGIRLVAGPDEEHRTAEQQLGEYLEYLDGRHD